MITNGKYKARAVGQVVLGTSSQKGTPFIELYFEITEGENKGGQARWTSYFSDKTSERTIEALQYCGWQGDDVGEFADGTLHGLDTNEVQIVIELESFEDRNTGESRTVPKVQWVNKLGGFLNVQNAMKPDAAASLGEKMRGLVLKSKSKMKEPDTGTDFPFGANAEPQKQASGAKKGW